MIIGSEDVLKITGDFCKFYAKVHLHRQYVFVFLIAFNFLTHPFVAKLDKYEIGNRLRFRPAFSFQLVSSPFLEYLLIATLGINSNDNKSSKVGPAMFN